MSTSRGERGAVAGLEGVLFAVLILVTGTLVVTNSWSVLQVRRSLDGAAREYIRGYTQAADPTAAQRDGRIALFDVLDGEGCGLAPCRSTDPIRRSSARAPPRRSRCRARFRRCDSRSSAESRRRRSG